MKVNGIAPLVAAGGNVNWPQDSRILFMAISSGDKCKSRGQIATRGFHERVRVVIPPLKERRLQWF